LRHFTCSFGWNYGEKLGWNLDFAPLAPDANDLTQKFQASVDDDFNFAEGLAILFKLAKTLCKARNIFIHQGMEGKFVYELSKNLQGGGLSFDHFDHLNQANLTYEQYSEQLNQYWQTLVTLAGVLGLEAKPDILPEISQNGLTEAEIEDLIQQRIEARKQKNFVEGDRLRDELKAKGITLIDQADGGTKWHR
jgi:cysteinyl-tRNA synthetase